VKNIQVKEKTTLVVVYFAPAEGKEKRESKDATKKEKQ